MIEKVSSIFASNKKQTLSILYENLSSICTQYFLSLPFRGHDRCKEHWHLGAPRGYGG